jgi:putative nucleotidyltransferase with HDIG domain
VALLMTIQVLPDHVHVTLNDLAREDVFAPRHVSYPDQHRTQLLRKLVGAQVDPVYSAVVGAEMNARQTVVGFFTAAAELRSPVRSESKGQRLETLRRQFPSLPQGVLSQSLQLTPEQARNASDAAQALVEEAMRAQIPPDALPRAQAGVRARAAERVTSPELRGLVGEVVALNLVPNQFFNSRDTETARQREMDQVPTQYETIRRGDLILRKGEKVTLDHLAKLQELGLIRGRVDVVNATSLVLLAFGLVLMFSLYLYQFHPHILRSFSSLLLMSVVVTGSLLLFRVASTALGLRFSGDQLGYLGMLCSALGAMLIAALLCPQIAVFVGVALALLTSVLVGADLKFAILSVVSSLVGVQAVRNIRNRMDIVRTGVLLSAANVLTALVAHGATQSDLPAEVGSTVVWGIIGGFASVLLFVLFAAWLERPFRLTTHLTLLELSDPNHHLLRRLQVEAPGTYHHSIIVGNLSEAAAEAISADALFCRVASYYHDVGKIIRPHFFVENQFSENRHNTINPSLSSLVVTSHVKDGVELAEEYRLPPPVIAIIKEHHGTCLLKYFYHQAVTASGEGPSSSLEYQFRYDGPRPQTKESGIIMLADSVEAASRTLEKPTPGRIRDLIERIVRDRLSDGQLDECELTFKDLEKIITSLTRSLASLLHARVEYPKGDTHDLRRLAADGSPNKEPVGSRKALADTPETAFESFFGNPQG